MSYHSELLENVSEGFEPRSGDCGDQEGNGFLEAGLGGLEKTVEVPHFWAEERPIVRLMCRIRVTHRIGIVPMLWYGSAY
jgi:hypothetical protein